MYLSKKISIYLARQMIAAQVITEEELSVYTFCYEYLLDLFLFSCSILLIGLLCHSISISLLFLLVMIPTRSLAGGIHANSSKTCTICSYGVYFAVQFIVPWAGKLFYGIWLVLLIICTLILLTLAPIDTPNKRLSPQQKKYNKKILFYYMAILHPFCALLLYTGHNFCFCTISLCGMIVAISVVLGYFRYKGVAA